MVAAGVGELGVPGVAAAEEDLVVVRGGAGDATDLYLVRPLS